MDNVAAIEKAGKATAKVAAVQRMNMMHSSAM